MAAPTPFTMEDVVNGVLLMMRYAAGRDVQIHLQSSIVQDANILYRTLMQKYTWRDYNKITQFTTDAALGTPVADLSAYVNKFSDIKAIWKDKDDLPLPFAADVTNPTAVSQPTVFSVGQPKVFAIYPTGVSSNCTLHAQPFQDTDFDLDDEVPFYKDILVLGTAYQLSVKAGINTDLTASILKQFEGIVQMYRLDEVKASYRTRPNNLPNAMSEWWVRP